MPVLCGKVHDGWCVCVYGCTQTWLFTWKLILPETIWLFHLYYLNTSIVCGSKLIDIWFVIIYYIWTALSLDVNLNHKSFSVLNLLYILLLIVYVKLNITTNHCDIICVLCSRKALKNILIISDFWHLDMHVLYGSQWTMNLTSSYIGLPLFLSETSFPNTPNHESWWILSSWILETSLCT